MVKMVPYEAFACPCGSGDVVLRESYKPKTRGKLYRACPRSKKEERVRLLVGSPGALTTPIYSPGSSSTPIYSPGSSTPPRYSPGASTSRNAKCSNCKHLLDKITVLEATVDMYMHPEQHTVNSAALFHEVYNNMGKLDLEYESPLKDKELLPVRFLLLYVWQIRRRGMMMASMFVVVLFGFDFHMFKSRIDAARFGIVIMLWNLITLITDKVFAFIMPLLVLPLLVGGYLKDIVVVRNIIALFRLTIGSFVGRKVGTTNPESGDAFRCVSAGLPVFAFAGTLISLNSNGPKNIESMFTGFAAPELTALEFAALELVAPKLVVSQNSQLQNSQFLRIRTSITRSFLELAAPELAVSQNS
ncbi:hypothetical protein Tco_0448101 [Tanacetum coccineum]